jgi:ABC-type phosphate/phosphonate transport system substrate-binding protein
MSSHFRKAAFAAAVLAGSTVFAQAEMPTELNFGVISTEASLNQKKNWEPFVEAMSKAIGIKVKAFYATDYAGVIEAMRFNKVHVAWYGNKSGIEAVDRANGEVLAQVVASCFKTVRNASHQVNAMAVANKQVDAATNNSEDLQRVEKTAPESRKQIKVIWTSPIIPLDPIVWRKDLDPAIKTKLYTFLMSYGRLGTDEENKQDREILGNLLWSPFHPSSDRQLIAIRKLEANKDLMKVQGDDKLSEAEKQEKVGKLKAELAKIEQMEKQAETDPYQKRVAAFVEAEKAGDKAAMKKMIAEFAAGFAGTH